MKLTLQQVQPGTLVERRTANSENKPFLDVITEVVFRQPGKVDQIIFRSGDVWIFSRYIELEFIGNFRLDRGEIELGPQIDYGEPRKVVSLSPEDLARIKETAPGLEE